MNLQIPFQSCGCSQFQNLTLIKNVHKENHKETPPGSPRPGGEDKVIISAVIDARSPSTF